jgi:hypothetical protein
MGWREFLQCTQTWRSRPLYLKVKAGDTNCPCCRCMCCSAILHPPTSRWSHACHDLQETIMLHTNCGTSAMGKMSVRAQLDWTEPLGQAFKVELEGVQISESSKTTMASVTMPLTKAVVMLLSGKLIAAAVHVQGRSTGCGCTACCMHRSTAPRCKCSCRSGRPMACSQRAMSPWTVCLRRSTAAAASSSSRHPRLASHRAVQLGMTRRQTAGWLQRLLVHTAHIYTS